MYILFFQHKGQHFVNGRLHFDEKYIAIPPIQIKWYRGCNKLTKRKPCRTWIILFLCSRHTNKARRILPQISPKNSGEKYSSRKSFQKKEGKPMLTWTQMHGSFTSIFRTTTFEEKRRATSIFQNLSLVDLRAFEHSWDE